MRQQQWIPVPLRPDCTDNEYSCLPACLPFAEQHVPLPQEQQKDDILMLADKVGRR